MAALFAGGALAAAACTGPATTADPNLATSASTKSSAKSSGRSSGKTSAATSAATRARGLHEVTYTISGSARRGMMTYATPSGQAQQTHALPWAKRFQAKSGQQLYVSAQNQGAAGSITCTVTVDGKRIKSNTSSGGYVIAACSGMLGF